MLTSRARTAVLAVVAMVTTACGGGNGESSYRDCGGFDGTTLHVDALLHSIAAIAEVEITDPAHGGFCHRAISQVHVTRWDIGGDAKTDIAVGENSMNRDLATIGAGHRAVLLLEDFGDQSDVRWEIQWALVLEPQGTIRYIGADPLAAHLDGIIRDATNGTNQLDDFVEWMRQQQASG